jgi:asparaginyl-tRNA synthetase
VNDALDLLSATSIIQAAALAGAREHYREAGLLELSVPVLVGITGACENVSTLFRVEGSTRVHLTQTGQLALEQALQFTDGLYCVTPSFRADAIDERHLGEFTLVEEEVSHTHPSIGMPGYDPVAMFEHLLDHIAAAVRAICGRVLRDAEPELERLGSDCAGLAAQMAGPFARISYSDAVRLLQEAGDTRLSWGDDLRAAQEAKIVDLVAARDGRPGGPTFVTHYPADIKFFNMRVDDQDPRCVQSADLILPQAGEAVGSAVREHEYARLLERLTGSVMFAHLQEQGLGSLADFEPYLETIRDGRTRPHAGYGIGLQRVIQYLLGSSDIRDSSVSYLLNRMTGFDRHLVSAQQGSRAPGF